MTADRLQEELHVRRNNGGCTMPHMLLYCAAFLSHLHRPVCRTPSASYFDSLFDHRRYRSPTHTHALQLRQTELEKINTLDLKIASEIKGLQERMGSMRDELVKFGDIQGLRAAAEDAKAVLQQKIESYQKRREGLRPAVAAAAADYERKRVQLSKDPQATALEQLEGKLKNYEQTVFTLRECE